MAVNWALGAMPRFDEIVQQGMQLGQDTRRQNFLMRLQEQQLQERQTDRQARMAAGQRVAAGDLPGARVSAAQSGNLELIQAINQLSTAERARATEQAQTLAPIYERLSRMPYEQRRAELQRIAPQLQARQIPADVIASYDPTDENLQTDIALGRRLSTPTAMQQNYEWLRLNQPDAADAYLRRQTEPLPRYITRPDGSVVMVAPPAGDDDEWEYTPPPGGPTPTASGTFP